MPTRGRDQQAAWQAVTEDHRFRITVEPGPEDASPRFSRPAARPRARLRSCRACWPLSPRIMRRRRTAVPVRSGPLPSDCQSDRCGAACPPGCEPDNPDGAAPSAHQAGSRTRCAAGLLLAPRAPSGAAARRRGGAGAAREWLTVGQIGAGRSLGHRAETACWWCRHRPDLPASVQRGRTRRPHRPPVERLPFDGQRARRPAPGKAQHRVRLGAP